MKVEALDVVIGVLYSISLELVYAAMVMGFMQLKSKSLILKKERIIAGLVSATFPLTLLAGLIWSYQDGCILKDHYIMAAFPALMVVLYIICYFCGLFSNEEIVELSLKAEDYQLNTVGRSNIHLKRIAVLKDTTIRFHGAAPSTPIDIVAYCKPSGDGLVCIGYECNAEDKKAAEGVTEKIHTGILLLAGFYIPITALPIFLWRRAYGPGDNPYMDLTVFALAIILFGGLRKYLKNATSRRYKFVRAASVVMYYVCIIVVIINTCRFFTEGL